jgi:hydrogenase expression/formation protein HypC
MCLALPAKILEKNGDEAWVLLGDARLKINLIMTPEAAVGDWVLVHAGFAIQPITEQDAMETWQLFDEMQQQPEEAAP